jgi:hypothetical protein
LVIDLLVASCLPALIRVFSTLEITDVAIASGDGGHQQSGRAVRVKELPETPKTNGFRWTGTLADKGCKRPQLPVAIEFSLVRQALLRKAVDHRSNLRP